MQTKIKEAEKPRRTLTVRLVGGFKTTVPVETSAAVPQMLLSVKSQFIAAMDKQGLEIHGLKVEVIEEKDDVS